MINRLSDIDRMMDSPGPAPAPAETPGAAKAAPAASGPPSHRDTQRTALRDLTTLSAESAATEAAVEQEHHAALETAERDRKAALWQAQERHRQLKESIERKYAERVSQLTAQYQGELNALNEADRQTKQRIEHESKSVERDVKKKFEQAAWLAESVFDGTAAGAREEFKKAREQHEADMTWLSERQQETNALVEKLRFRPPVAEPAPPAEASEGDSTEAWKAQHAGVERDLRALYHLKLARLFVGATPFLLTIALSIGAAIGAHFYRPATPPDVRFIGYAAGGTLAGCIILLILLRILSQSQVRKAHAQLRGSLEGAFIAGKRKLDDAKAKQDQTVADAARLRDDETKQAREKLSPFITQAHRRRDAALQAAQADYAAKLPQIESRRDKARAEADEFRRSKTADADQRHGRDVEAVEARYHARLADAQHLYTDARAKLERRLEEGLAQARSPIIDKDRDGQQEIVSWDDPAWNAWKPPKTFPPGVRFGELQVDLRAFAIQVASGKSQTSNLKSEISNLKSEIPQSNGGSQIKLDLPDPFSVPVALAFPSQASMLIQTDRTGRPAGMAALQMVMTRLLTSLPAGRVRFTIFDPVGLGQNFAGFMHLADHDDALVGGRIWTERDQIEQRLADLTEHMETVIQKYLRNEFETIDDYNAQAGELAEPYRFLVIADFPAAFEQEAFNRLAAIVNSGARCGIYTLILRDTRQPLPQGTLLDELEAHSVTLSYDSATQRFTWKDEVFKQFPLTLDPQPSDEFLTRILDVVGRAAKDANRVEVPFDTIAPKDPEFWSLSTTDELRLPVGRMGATRLQYLKLGRGVAQHLLIAGKTGSGKSTLLNAIITNLGMWYSPDEVELYLIDFKKGVEFKTYATHNLPHARAIAVESDREFGLSVLQRLDAELTRRGDLFRKLGVQDLPSYRATVKSPSPGTPGEGRGEGSAQYPTLPRTLLIIDEFQEFFTEDDKLAQDAALLLDRLVRQGRAFGVHVILGSQTIGGSSGLARSTMGQMAVRIALQTSEADSQLILGDGNSAARLLTRPGEAIYNDAGGLVEANSPFQIAWLPDEHRERFLERVRQISNLKSQISNSSPIVFEGNAPADVHANKPLLALLDAPQYPTSVPAPLAFVGEPVAIKDPTSVTLRRQSGANLLLVGQQEESAMAILVSAIISLAAQHKPDRARFVILDGSPADSPLGRVFPTLKEHLPHELRLVEYRSAGDALHELTEEMQRRQTGEDPNPPAIYFIIYGLQRYRILRKSEDSFSFSASDEEKKPQPDKEFTDLLREGPHLGIHTLTWCDTPASVERTIDRNSMREFDNRILFQMSAADSSNLIDSPLANKLGFHRALVYSEEQGLLEKFRPYALPTPDWLARVRDALNRRT